ncbi:MAG TPA: Na+/H+ antiporter subunit E [Actinomycetota bacterium]|nr:Na+/H+ antiporter subunit E [Actinomycetota bacterium]
MAAVLRRMKFWLAWYVTLFGLWLLFVDTLAAQQLILGAVAAAVAATPADVVRSQDLVRFRMRSRWLRGLGVLPGQVMTESWLLAVALWRQLRRPGSVRGQFRVLPFPVEGDDAAAAARRALVTGVVSLVPNTYVVGVERGEGAMLVHQLVRRRGGEVPSGMLEE